MKKKIGEQKQFILTLHDHYCASVHHNNHGSGHHYANCDDFEFDFGFNRILCDYFEFAQAYEKKNNLKIKQ